jgi:uncharacterized protein (DUF2461 family)
VASRYARFYPETIRFLELLAANNNREWFNEHKSRYEEDVLDVALRFIQSMQDPLQEIAPHFVALPTRISGSLMRVYRDTRFSKNKTPYKTNIGIQFRHEQARDVHSPGYYVHIAPEQVFVRPAEWKRAMDDRRFKRQFELGGESLVRPPRGFDKEHECIDDIRRKSFIAVREFASKDCLKPQFQRTVESSFKTAEPFMRFLCMAVGVRF